MLKLKKSQRVTVGIFILILAIFTLGIDRIFVSADNGNFGQSMTVLTIISLILFLVGAIWLFRTTFE